MVMGCKVCEYVLVTAPIAIDKMQLYNPHAAQNNINARNQP
jgi:hypothetical protein